jgi:hypothetical protein
VTLQLVEHHEGNGTIVRVLDCDCPLPNCARKWLVATVEGRYSPLWVCVETAWEGFEPETLELLLANEEVEGVTPASVIEHALALIGLPWPVLVAGSEVAFTQLMGWMKLPGWMERLPHEEVWACRRVAFGHPLTRVPRALFALHRSYVDEGPVAADDLFSRGRPAVDGPPDLG